MLFPKVSISIVFVLVSLNLAGCGQSDDQSSPVDALPQATTTRYDWYMEGTTPAGQTTIVRTENSISNDSYTHWNNRKYTLKSQLELDDNGYPVSQTISGTSAFGASIDEAFSYREGTATWKTPGEGGSVDTDEPAFYWPNESAALGSLSALVRAAANSIDGTVRVFPAGTARTEKLTELEVSTPTGPRLLSLYAISGLSFTPNYAWFDEDLELVAIDRSGWMGMVPAGWGPETLSRLSEAQGEQDARLVEQLVDRYAKPLPAVLIIENVNVVDVAAGELLEGRHVTLAEGKIQAIDTRPNENLTAQRIDGTGKYLIPGLWDMHGHFSLSDGALNIAGGVTSVRDIGGVHEKVIEMTSKFDSGQVIGPNTYRAGFMDKAGPFASGWAAESLQDALDRVDFFAANGYIQIKLYSSIEPDWVKPIAERAHAHGMRLSGHIPAFMSAEQAVRAGYDEIQHINMVFLNFLAGDREDTRKLLRFTLYGDEAGNLDLESDEVQAFFKLLKDENVVVDATAAIFETQLVHTTGNPDPTFAKVIGHLPPSVARPLYNTEMDAGDKAAAWARSGVQQSAMLKALYDHGVQLVPGSDHMAAFTLHRELEVYAEAGIAAAAVLRMATLDSAGVIGVADSSGSIAVGKDSDLVLIEDNPLEDISAVRRAVLVVKGTTAYRPDELYSAMGVKPFVSSIDF